MERNVREHENIGEHDRTSTGQTDVINSWDPLQTRKDTPGLFIYLCRVNVTLATERRSYTGSRSFKECMPVITGQRVGYIGRDPSMSCRYVFVAGPIFV